MSRRRVLVAVLLTMLVPSIFAVPRAVAVERPPRLAPASGCELWIGTASGNDPSTQIELQLCPQPDASVSGSLQWSSTMSGWNLRDVSGRYDASGAELTLRDDRIRAQRPETGWRFCNVDRYTLRRDGDRLRGRYHSTACHDDGTLDLTRSASVPAPSPPPGVPGPAPQEPGPAPAPPDQQPTPAPAPAPSENTPTPMPPPPSRGRFGCSI